VSRPVIVIPIIHYSQVEHREAEAEVLFYIYFMFLIYFGKFYI